MTRASYENTVSEIEMMIKKAFPGAVCSVIADSTVASSDVVKSDTTSHGRELMLDVEANQIRLVSSYVNSHLEGALIDLFACDDRSQDGVFTLRYVFLIRKSGLLIVLLTRIDPVPGQFISISGQVHAAAAYEREIKDMFGLIPVGHPDPRSLVFHGNWPEGHYPLRKDYDKNHKPVFEEGLSTFRTIAGEGVYEIPVGPVHAGIIEPGHFRFSLAGEPIQNLEAQLYFTHKGIEKLSEGMSFERCFYLSERISGDETFTNSLAYSMAIETIAGVHVPARGEALRILYAELERLTCHMGDLVGICLDVAYGFGAFQFRLLRNWCYQLADLLCGSRFLRSVNIPGGIRTDLPASIESEVLKRLTDLKRELDDTADIVRQKTMLVDRLENTGVLAQKIAVDLNAVGPPARASGLPYDIRKILPYGAYAKYDFDIPTETGGDVSCRMKVKLAECYQSIRLMTQVVETLAPGPISTTVERLPAGQSAFGITEAPRGENVHWVLTGENGTIARYKARTPSFCNWPVLCHAVQGNIVPDFPLINKSFNLSYAGNDL
jgi:Ni,Fe-hydrogenase III large subunit/Ni,Fe-hydrogenase III component G